MIYLFEIVTNVEVEAANEREAEVIARENFVHGQEVALTLIGTDGNYGTDEVAKENLDG